MQAISEIMTRDVSVISPEDNVKHAAEMMRDQDIGSLPVCNGKRLVGMLTDRDITIRAVASGKAPADIPVQEAMSERILWCFEDQTIGEVLEQMGQQQVRRIPVVSRNMDLVGLVSLGDLARDNEDTEQALEEISAPTPPNQSRTGRSPTMRP